MQMLQEVKMTLLIRFKEIAQVLIIVLTIQLRMVSII